MNYKNLSYLVLLVVALLTVASIFFASRLRFDYNFDNFFPKGDPDLAYYFDYRDKFGNDNDYLLIGIDNNKSLFDQQFLTKVDSLTSFLQRQPNVESVLSPTTVKSPVIEAFGYFEIPYLHVAEPERYEQDSVVIYSSKELVGTLFSEDATSVSLFVQTSDDLGKQESDTLIAALNQKLEQLNLPNYHVAGKALAQSVFVEKMKIELAIFMSASIVLVILFLWITFRTAWGVLVPLLVVLLSVIWALGVMGLFNKPIDIMTVLLPTIMFVVGMSDVIHILSRYMTEISHGAEKMQALKVTLREVGLATLLTSVTTAVGFLTLLTTAIVPIRNFGLFTAISIGLAFILAFSVLPAILLLIKKPNPIKARKVNLSWPVLLRRMLTFVFRKPTVILSVSALVTVVSLVGISQIKVDTTLLEDLGDEDPIILDFKYFEEKFSGVRPFELHLKAAPGHTLYDYEVLKEIEEIENYLYSTYGLNFITSPATVVKTINRAQNGGLNQYYTLPESKQQMQSIKRRLQAFKNRSELRSVVTADALEGRLSGKMTDIGSAKATVLNDSLRSFIAANINPSYLQTRLTGSALLLDKNNEYVTLNMMQGLLIAFGVIAVIVGIIFRSLRMVLISLVPNIIPLLMIGGIMGFMGINMTVSVSIVFTIAFGIAVDDTIHFLSKLKLELAAGRSLPYAIKRTFISAGKAIIITSCILMGGFMTLILSTFDATYYVGFFVGLTLLFAVVADLYLLPVLILYFYKPPKKVKL
ncbi:efflux RND transporter permease subunit [Pontibacter cellulosilyticus]|uniref:MMPL family transporter n=1 Tax=Pontibacter cellulosilyticus TaxID=1720253 RepID=A0A923N2L6_9BACT|nr:MMPL family transporter [Pontibacter cellulosilyticus]MBC5991740.1 MMPL family transporter [Pontibacter cellulosilyticus]